MGGCHSWFRAPTIGAPCQEEAPSLSGRSRYHLWLLTGFPRDSALSALSCQPSSVSLVQVTRGGGGGGSPGLGSLEGCISLQLRRDPGTLAPPCSARQPPSPFARGDYTWRGVCECVRACGRVCVWMWRASQPAWGGGRLRGGGRAGLLRTSPLHSPGFWR